MSQPLSEFTGAALYLDTMIAEFYPRIAPQLARLRAFPHLRWIDLTTSDLDAMDESILRYHIRPRDALHLAAMRTWLF